MWLWIKNFMEFRARAEESKRGKRPLQLLQYFHNPYILRCNSIRLKIWKEQNDKNTHHKLLFEVGWQEDQAALWFEVGYAVWVHGKKHGELVQKVLGCFQGWLAYSEEPMEDLTGEKEMNPDSDLIIIGILSSVVMYGYISLFIISIWKP